MRKILSLVVLYHSLVLLVRQVKAKVRMFCLFPEVFSMTRNLHLLILCLMMRWVMQVLLARLAHVHRVSVQLHYVTSIVKPMNLTSDEREPCVLAGPDGLVVIYVDDILIASPHEGFAKKIHDLFEFCGAHQSDWTCSPIKRGSI